MSEERVTNSIYGSGLSDELSESSLSNIEYTNESSLLYSTGSIIDSTDEKSALENMGMLSETSRYISDFSGCKGYDTDHSESKGYNIDHSESKGYDTDHSGSKGYDTDHSGSKGYDTDHSESNKSSEHTGPNNNDPFIFDGEVIRYNTGCGINYKTPVIFGSRKTQKGKTNCGYSSSHLIFDPESGTLAAGWDVKNKWDKLPNFSLISGIGNSAGLDASFISGSHNHIKSDVLPVNSHCSDVYCVAAPACAIIGGSNNTISNTSSCNFSSSIIVSSGMTVRNCVNTVVLGMTNLEGEPLIEGFNESTITRNLFGVGQIHAGPLTDIPLPVNTVLNVNGDALFYNDVTIDGTIKVDTLGATTIVATNIIAQNIFQNSVFVSGPDTHILRRGDGIDIVYANPSNNVVKIQLGDHLDPYFEPNRIISFKDVSLESENALSSYDVQITAPSYTTGEPIVIPVRIEYYDTDGNLTVGTNAGYAINTAGGAVAFRYYSPDVPGASPTWVINTQFMGNSRVSSSTNFTFIPASEHIRKRLIRCD